MLAALSLLHDVRQLSRAGLAYVGQVVAARLQHPRDLQVRQLPGGRRGTGEAQRAVRDVRVVHQIGRMNRVTSEQKGGEKAAAQ